MGNKLTLGILAHVDAGKTTLAEAILYTCGQLRSLGRVDHQDAFLDHFALERERGITIFSKQALFTWKDLQATLLDTPGHVDFSAEMERTLQVLDYAVLVIDGADGVQGHTRTLWRLLKKYGIPTFLFVNKMDREGTVRETLLEELQSRLDSACVEFGGEELWDNLALCSEELLEEYLQTGKLDAKSIACAVAERRVFPCYFGSALKLQGITELLDGMETYSLETEYPAEFGARVFKISRDSQGNRLTHVKVTGGVLRARQLLGNPGSALSGRDKWQEKADQIRIYNGSQYQVAEQAVPGDICAVTGLTRTRVGQGLGFERENALPVLEPVLTYQIILPEGGDPVVVYRQLKELEEEEPLLRLVWLERTAQIHAQVMGEVQIEVLKRLITERFGLEVTFGKGSIVYKETIGEAAIGIGHFEPLRHYAEVQLLLEPGEPGSGLQFASLCREDMLDKNWQRLVLSHLEERAHAGVLTGAEITDMRISLIGGRAHAKHTEGGDFRQATYRALRQGLRSSRCLLLEPVFAFTLEVPGSQLGRAMSDIKRMQGSFESPVTLGENSILTGRAPAAAMQGYQREVNAYTRGFGRLSLSMAGYEPCHNTEEVVAAAAYDPEADLENPTGSVFCAHGAGFVVPWNQVPEYAHVDSGFRLEPLLKENPEEETARGQQKAPSHQRVESDYISQEEIDAIFRQLYGKREEKGKRFGRYHKTHTDSYRRREEGAPPYRGQDSSSQESYLLVDGYNIIFAWPVLKELAQMNMDSARDRLMDMMCNYQGYLGSILILVFDAYKVKGNPGSVLRYHNIYVVYTREAETADQYIEKAVHKIGGHYRVTVATSDALEQMIVWGEGAVRMSAMDLFEALERASRELRETYHLTD
ncbi:MAG: TetM/TetW/TetO/TetS family tetracycline resistance ribosomal protection protein [Roseburia sp.]|nr:TetM/TetW/TetO/TetS family tetracycline resistance ribosomal protection protein [Roseburia sp.]